jgi:hypothetical protein
MAKGPGPREEAQAKLDSPETEKESSHSAQAADERVAVVLPGYPPPATDADRIVAASRARTFGLHVVPRISLRETNWNADVLAMQRVPECSLSALWRARGQDVDRSMRRRTSFAVTLAWDGKKLIMQTEWNTSDAGTATPERHIQCRYWDGGEGWLGEISPRIRQIYRYRTIDQLFEGVVPFDFAQLPAAGGRLPWPGPLLVLGKYEISPALTRYELAATETVDSVKCDVYDGPARHERLWIERSTGLVKALCRQFVQSTLPNYYTELIREVAGRTFVDAGEYRQWVKDQPADLQAKLAAHWSVAHWPLSKPGNLTVFSDYREIAPGVRWPMRCERIVVHRAGRDEAGGYKYFRAESVVTHVAEEFSIRELARSALPQLGDPVVDRRFDPPIEYPWKETLPEFELQAAWQERAAARRREEEEERRINDTPINSVSDAIEILTEGPKTDPTKVWARAIKYLVDHREEALPALIKQLDAERRDHPISKLTFALRAIGDHRAVPALIRALPRTLLPGRSDYGLTLDDWELCRFMQQHDQSGKVRDGGNYFDYGRAFREVISALHRLTGQDFGEMQLNWVRLADTESQRRQQRKQFHKFAHRWADWWERNWESMVKDPKYARVNLPPLPGESPLLVGRRRPPVGQRIKLIGQNAGGIVASVDESTSDCFVDLDTDRQAGWPKSLPQLGKIGLDSPELLAWAREEGFDLVGVSHTPEGESTPLYCLKPIDMYVWKITEQEHRTLKQAMAGKTPYPLTQPVNLMIPRRKIPQPYDSKYSGDAFLFVTREGTAGLVRITAQVTDTIVGLRVASGDSQFLPIGFYRGAKINFGTMTEPSGAVGAED